MFLFTAGRALFVDLHSQWYRLTTRLKRLML